VGCARGYPSIVRNACKIRLQCSVSYAPDIHVPRENRPTTPFPTEAFRSRTTAPKPNIPGSYGRGNCPSPLSPSLPAFSVEDRAANRVTVGRIRPHTHSCHDSDLFVRTLSEIVGIGPKPAVFKALPIPFFQIPDRDQWYPGPVVRVPTASSSYVRNAAYHRIEFARANSTYLSSFPDY